MMEKIKSPLRGGTKQKDVLFVALSAMTLPVLFGYYFIATIIEPEAAGAMLDNIIMIAMFFVPDINACRHKERLCSEDRSYHIATNHCNDNPRGCQCQGKTVTW